MLHLHYTPFFLSNLPLGFYLGLGVLRLPINFDGPNMGKMDTDTKNFIIFHKLKSYPF